jgi:hypothetical protein
MPEPIDARGLMTDEDTPYDVLCSAIDTYLGTDAFSDREMRAGWERCGLNAATAREAQVCLWRLKQYLRRASGARG